MSATFTQPALLDLPTPPRLVPVVRDEIDAVADDWRPWAVEDRAVVLRAVARTAAECDGMVHATDVRARLDREVNPRAIGAVICALVRQGVLEDTGWVRRIGEGTMRNRTKRLPVRRLVKPIPA